MNANQIRAALAKRTIVAPSGCHEWIGYRASTGYGLYSGAQMSGWPVTAHRLSYMVHVSTKVHGLHVDHLCRNRACVNPLHLQAVTPRVNALRGMGLSGMNARKTHCPAGHPYAGEHLAVIGGRRHCLTCIKRRAAVRLEKVRAARVPKPARTHCGNGHELTTENVRFINGDPGRPMCRPCQRVRSAAYKARKRAERAAA